MAAAFLLGNVPDPLQRRVGLAIVLGAAAIVVANKPDRTSGEFLSIPLLFAIAWLAGFAVRERSAQAEAAEERASLAERERDAAARIAVAEERARIARELHDIVAHAVSVMVLHVGAVRHSLPDGRARTATRSARRADGPHGARRDAPAARRAARRERGPTSRPSPASAASTRCSRTSARAGPPRPSCRSTASRRRCRRAIDLSAYRIVQEGLTNALKHAHAEPRRRHRPLRARRAADRRPRRRPRRRDGDGLGHGLVGIRERVKIYGGEMSAGTANGGGFVLTTSFPLDGPRGRP